MPQQDFRARLQPKTFSRTAPNNDVLGPNSNDNILFPLWETRGVLFPYTPSLISGNKTKYDKTEFTHTNYGYNAYVLSYPEAITLTPTFTAQTEEEALYMLAVIHFFRSVTKSYFGISPYEKAGTPPPILLFNYLGEHQYNNVPVVVTSFNFEYKADIDYVPINTSQTKQSTSSLSKQLNLPRGSADGYTYVPTYLSATVELDTQYLPSRLRTEFNLDDFRQGKLMNKGYI